MDNFRQQLSSNPGVNIRPHVSFTDSAPNILRPTTQVQYNNPPPSSYMQSRMEPTFDRFAINNAVENSIKTEFGNIKTGFVNDLKAGSAEVVIDITFLLLLFVVIICIIVMTTYYVLSKIKHNKELKITTENTDNTMEKTFKDE